MSAAQGDLFTGKWKAPRAPRKPGKHVDLTLYPLAERIASTRAAAEGFARDFAESTATVRKPWEDVRQAVAFLGAWRSSRAHLAKLLREQRAERHTSSNRKAPSARTDEARSSAPQQEHQ